MKRIVIALVLIVAVIAGSVAVFADEVSPFYIGTNSHVETLIISSNGVATMRGEVVPKNSTVYDKVNIEFELIKVGQTNSVYTGGTTVRYDSNHNLFYWEKNMNLSSRGTYQLEVTYKCYKNNSLVETIYGSSYLTTY